MAAILHNLLTSTGEPIHHVVEFNSTNHNDSYSNPTQPQFETNSFVFDTSSITLAHSYNYTEHVDADGASSSFSYILTQISRYFCVIFMIPGCFLVACFGVGSNILNIIVFYRQGLRTDSCTANLFCLSISDFFACAVKLAASASFMRFGILHELFGHPFDIAMVNGFGLGLVLNSQALMFTASTAWITIFISVERMVSVTFPFHVKRILTPKRAYAVDIAIFTLAIGTNVPRMIYDKVVFISDATRSSNESLSMDVGYDEAVQPTGLIPLSLLDEFVALVDLWLLTFCFFIVVALNTILVVKVNQTKDFRKSNSGVKVRESPIALSADDTTKSKKIDSPVNSSTTDGKVNENEAAPPKTGADNGQDLSSTNVTVIHSQKSSNTNTTKTAKKAEKETVLTRMMILVCALYIACYIPVVCYALFERYFLDSMGKTALANVLDITSIFSVTVNSSFNALIYNSLSTRYRTTLRRLFCFGRQ